ncbi:MAG: ABC transporter substrate-binding protein [Gammaproteobacteria bacterium]|jgi:NitT/TauT family transport system substrate-binding protein|nr:ABC transporter substrate-binding protein [Gammaproteobacteria bacterium]
MRFIRFTLLLISICTLSIVQAKPLTIGYSDWPGWVAWEVGVEKGWFDEAGVEVAFEWFDYVASMDAYAAGQLDAVCMTNGDALVTGATARLSNMALINDFSNGNDMIVALPGITSVTQLKGKKVGVEIGFVGHLLLLKALEKAGLTEDDVDLVNVSTNETPMVLASGEVDAIVAWQPNSSLSLQMVPGATSIYSSANDPGLIYDTLAIAPESLNMRPVEWAKVFQVWYRIVEFINDPATQSEAIQIMAARVGVAPEAYAKLMQGTRFLDQAEAKEKFSATDDLTSLQGSSKIADAFNVKYKVYSDAQNTPDYINDSLYQ